MATNTFLIRDTPTTVASAKLLRAGIRSATMVGLLLSSTLMASEPDEASIAERGRMGIEAYTRVMDAFEVPDTHRLSVEAVTAYSGADTLLEAMQTARAAQREALEGEDRRFGYIDVPDAGAAD